MAQNKSVRGTQTEKNLMTSFAGESQARNRYTYYAGQAKKDGYEQISQIFSETADQERMHAKRFFSFLEGGDVKIEYEYPADIIRGTYDNLLAAAAGERFENTEMYPGFAEVAREEGFPQIAILWQNVANAEVFHERRYTELAENIDKGRVFKRGESETWRCLKCGYIHEGNEAPKNCPACMHPQAWFELLCTNW
jgi:rubrerythrin